MTASYCRHRRRPRWRVAVPFAVAVLVLTMVLGLRVGTALGSADLVARTTTSTCQEGHE